jgi:hypothetical protein
MWLGNGTRMVKARNGHGSKDQSPPSFRFVDTATAALITLTVEYRPFLVQAGNPARTVTGSSARVPRAIWILCGSTLRMILTLEGLRLRPDLPLRFELGFNRAVFMAGAAANGKCRCGL